MDGILAISVLACVVVIFGTFGNVTSLIVWWKGKRCSGLACAIDFMSLAVVDTFFLTIISSEWVLAINGIKIIRNTQGFCQFIMYFGAACPQLSAWITVVITAKRLLCVKFPLRFRIVHQKKTTLILLFFILIVCLAINSYELILLEVFEYEVEVTIPNTLNNGTLLEYNDMYKHIKECYSENKLYFVLLAAVSAILTWCIPFVVIISCNVFMIVNLVRNSKLTTNTGRIARHQNITDITRIVVATGLLHCISTLPNALIMFDFWLNLWPDLQQELGLMMIFCLCLNSGLNCAVYCFSGRNFRRDAKDLFTCKQRLCCRW